VLAACGARPPKELSGLWSTGPAACAAGLGVTFRRDGVWAHYAKDEFVLMAAPRYTVTPTPDGALVRIDYKLPGAPGGVAADLGRGVIELERSRMDRLRPVRSRFVDLRTGAATLPLHAGPMEQAMQLARCPKPAHGG
jgi:hypothetical protein